LKGLSPEGVSYRDGGALGLQLEIGEEFLDACAEVGLRRDEAKDQVVVGREVVEVAGVEEDVVMAEEMDGKIFVGGAGGGVAECGVPAGFGVEEFAGGVGAKLRLEVGAIFADAGEDLRAEGVALGEESGECGLGGGAEGEIGVGDDFEALEGGADLGVGAGYRKPGDFHLGESGDFGEPAQGEGEDFGVCGEGFARRGVEGEIEEDFVDDEREIVFFAESV